ncbi:MAG: 3-isopropylmalate dehydratase small subunit, partial [uncultured Solirubrobacteraceae bacterium]
GPRPHRRRIGQRARPRRRRHRPDHPQAVPQARGADRLRRVPVLRLGAGARLEPAGQPDPRRRAELRLRLQSRARAVGAPGLRLPVRRIGVVRRHLLLQLHQDRPAAGGAARRRRARPHGRRRGRSRPRGPGGPLRRARGALRDRSRDPAPAAQRPRRHRPDPPAGRRHRRLRARRAEGLRAGQRRASRPGHLAPV